MRLVQLLGFVMPKLARAKTSPAGPVKPAKSGSGPIKPARNGRGIAGRTSNCLATPRIHCTYVIQFPVLPRSALNSLKAKESNQFEDRN